MVSCLRSEGITRVLQYLRRLPALLVLLLLEIESLLAGVDGGEGKLRIPVILEVCDRFVKLKEERVVVVALERVIECRRLWFL